MQVLPLLSGLMPTVLALAGLARVFPGCSFLPLLASSWLVGQVGATTLAYLVACALVGVASPTLEATHKIILLVEAFALLVLILRSFTSIRNWAAEMSSRMRFGDLLSSGAFLLVATLFSYFLFSMQLYSKAGLIYRSRVYWDFTAHYPIVQNFVFGDNFPARDETAAELPLLYHFFSDLQVAQYVSLGFDLPEAFLLVSVLSLVSLLVLVKGLAEELFQSRVAGWMSAALVVTSSNLRWIFDLTGSLSSQDFFSPIFQAQLPSTFSMITTPLGDFNLSMVNLFYFVEERHVIFGSALLIAVIYLKRALHEITLFGAIVGGVCLSLFCNWNFFLLPMFLLVLLPGIVLGPSRTAHILMAAVVCCVAGVGAMSMTEVLKSSPWFQPPARYPIINLSFATATHAQVITVRRFFEFYLVCMGPTIVCALCGAGWLWKRRRNDFWLIMPVAVGTFILINSVQAMSTSVYENHKWVKPWQQVVNVLAVAPFMLLRYRPKIITVTACSMIALLLTASGIMEAIPFFHRVQDVRFAPYPSKLVDDIRAHTKPQDAFATMKPREILLAGRRIFYLRNEDLRGTIPHLRGLKFKFKERESEQLKLYSAMTKSEFCQRAHAVGIQVVEFSPDQRRLPIFLLVKEYTAFEGIPYESTDSYAYVRTDFCAQEAADTSEAVSESREGR